MAQNVFILGLDSFNERILKELPRAAEYTFHPLLTYHEIRGEKELPAEELLELARKRLREFDGSRDAIIAFFDFPVTTILPILAREFEMHAPSLEAVLKCEHKYWSRLEQREVIPHFIPQFFGFDPFNEQLLEELPLLFPYWIKPAKSFRSYLAFRVNDLTDFVTSIHSIRDSIGKVSEPFSDILHRVRLPEAVDAIGAHCCIAESPLTGQQCTVEGYAFDGEIEIYGVVDSVQEADRSSFSRYEYPSRLPLHVRETMRDLTSRVMKQIGYDNGTFNVEFFYSQTENRPYLLEINPRMSQSHAYLFQQVDGASHHQIQIDVANGRRPTITPGAGPFARAAKFMLRYHENGRITSVPSQETIEAIEREIPGTRVEVLVERGVELASLANQDSYSFEIADIYIAANSEEELLTRYATVTERLSFEVESAQESLEAPRQELEDFADREAIPD